ncbi:unnamed protein product [Lactuca virosa]|uniref:TF-B3 domain-containing protein n=1 Tax=Lactuca virosa TaxID=75947 RepID=A0AAU9PL95_9ASTR|nr:unnamed protein product [Lactuca virosa]
MQKLNVPHSHAVYIIMITGNPRAKKLLHHPSLFSPFPNHTMKFHRRLSPPENPVNFLKVILSDDTQSTGIRMPKKFTEKHGKDLLERVILKVPNGDVWRVDLQKSGDEIWLENGWPEFAEHYGLGFGHLLMFNYEGFSIFGVIIFDTSALEIVYPPMKKDPLRNSTKEMSRKNPQEVKLTKLKTVKIEEETCSSSEDESPRVKINVGGEYSRKSLAVGRVKATFKSHKPFFVACIQKTYLVRKRGLRVPHEFKKKYWSGGKKHSKYLLKLANGGRQKTWEVFAYDDDYLGYGDWRMFVKENGIKVGHICVFELIHTHQNVFHVTIIRSTT